jgi:hypothetical protein
LERGKGFLCVLVSGLRVSPENLLSLRLYVVSECRNKIFKIRYHIPFPTFSIASKPKARCAS